MFCKFAHIGDGGIVSRKRVRCVRCSQPNMDVPIATPLYRIRRRCTVPGWGDWVSHWLAVGLGVDKPRFAHWIARLRVTKTNGCGCGARQEALNEAGWKVEQWWRWLRGQV